MGFGVADVACIVVGAAAAAVVVVVVVVVGDGCRWDLHSHAMGRGSGGVGSLSRSCAYMLGVRYATISADGCNNTTPCAAGGREFL